MLGSYPVIAFVVVKDPVRARAFYVDTLGLTFVSQDQYALVLDAHGVMVRAAIAPNHVPAQHTVLGWHVPDINAAVDDLLKAGVQFEKYSFMHQDERGIWTPPGSTNKVAWFKDPDGNVLSVSQH